MTSFQWPHNEDDRDLTEWNNSQEPDPGDTNVRFTTIPRRATAICIDWMLPYLAMIIIGNDIFSTIAELAMMANSIVLQGMTGQSLGKMAVGLKLAYVPEKMSKRKWTFITPGVGRCALRYVLHILDLICLVGFFKALINPWGRSFADALTSCVVICDDRIELMSRDEAVKMRVRLQILELLQGRRLPRGALVRSTRRMLRLAIRGSALRLVAECLGSEAKGRDLVALFVRRGAPTHARVLVAARPSRGSPPSTAYRRWLRNQQPLCTQA